MARLGLTIEVELTVCTAHPHRQFGSRLISCLFLAVMPNKWRARTSRGKKKNNKPRTNAERDNHKSEAALAERETKRQARIQAKNRAAAQAKADEIQARVNAKRRIDPPAPKWAAKPKRQLLS